MINVIGITKIDVNVFLNDRHDFKAKSRYRIFNTITVQTIWLHMTVHEYQNTTYPRMCP